MEGDKESVWGSCYCIYYYYMQFLFIIIVFFSYNKHLARSSAEHSERSWGECDNSASDDQEEIEAPAENPVVDKEFTALYDT